MRDVPKILGVDPGNKGAIGMIGEAYPKSRRLPMMKKKTTTRTKTLLDAGALARVLQDWSPDLAVVEDVYSSPQMGVVGAFSFGENRGTILGVLGALEIPVLLIHPSSWKTKMHIPADKAKSKAAAQRLFPGTRIPNADEAEALLLALYGMLYGGVTSNS